MRWWLAAACGSLFFPLVAQNQAPKKGARAGAPKAPAAVIEELAVEGNSRYSAQQVLEVSGLRRGQAPAQQVFEAARDRLLATGAFMTVGWRWEPRPQGGFRATIEVQEADQFLPWAIDRLPIAPEEFAAQAARELPLFGKEVPTSEAFLSRLAEVAGRLARERGLEDEVVARVQLLGKDQLVVLLQPKTPPPRIARVLVTGLKVVPVNEVQRALNQIAIGSPFTEQNVRFLFDTQARPIFEAFGRLTARIVSISAQPEKEIVGVAVTLEVDEGEAFELAGVRVEGAPVPEPEIEKLAEWPVGKTANYSAVGASLNKVLDHLRRQGYMQVKYKGERRLDTEQKKVWLTIFVDPGPQFTMGRLEIVGLDLESEPVIRKMYTNKTGEPFNSEYPEAFLKMVREQGIFDFLGETKAERKIDEKTLRVDVVLTFKAEPLPEQRRRRRGGIP